MSEYRILDNTVTPLVGHFQDTPLFPSKFVCDEELNMNKLLNATVKFKVGIINGRDNTVNSLPTSVASDLNTWQKFPLGDNLDFFVYLTRTDGYYNAQYPIYNYKIGSLDSPINLGHCEAWSNNYNVGGGKKIKDVDLKSTSNNEFYKLNKYQPQISNNAYISWLAVYDNVVKKIYLCEPTNSDNLGILTDFKIASSDFLLNFIDDYDYNYANLLDKNLDNKFLSIKATAEITPYVNYEEYSEYDDGNGSNPGQSQNDENVGGDGNHDNSSDTTDSSDYYNEDNDSPFEPQVHDPSWNGGTALYTLFKMSFSQIGNLIDYLCSNTWQSTVTNLGLGNVFGAIAKCITVPFDVRPSTDRWSSIKILGIDTNLSSNGVVNHLQTIDCGTITIDRYFGDFKDYSPYTKCFIYLPYIGVNEISINQVQGKSLNLVYGVDLLDGSCVARVSADDKQLYSFSGNIATEYPIVGKTPSSPLAAATNILGDISGNSTLVATVGLLGSVLTGQNSSSAFQTVGGVAGNWGNVAVLTPFVYLERPVQSIPNAYESCFGWTCNKYLKLDNLTGYTEVDESIHLSTTATDEEKEMLKEILTSGFYIN